MNYFGHAAIASQRDRDPGFILGAMLPDLCAMTGLGGEESLEGVLGRGVRFHLDTDALFHQTRVFCEHNRRLQARFRQLGVSRGPARAAAHLGVEMLIDAELARVQSAVDDYLDALNWGVRNVPREVRAVWALPGQLKLTGLCQYLLDRGPGIHCTARERFVERLGRALGGRRLLSPSPEELQVIAEELHRDRSVAEQVPDLLAELGPLSGGEHLGVCSPHG